MKRLMLFFVVIFCFMLLSVRADESLSIKYNNVDLILSKPGIMSYSSFFDQVLSNPGVNVRVDSVARTLSPNIFYNTKEARTTYLVYNPKTNIIDMSINLQQYEQICISAIAFCATVFLA